MAIGTVGLQTHIWNNNLKSMIFLGLYPVLIMGLVWLCSLTVEAFSGGLENGFSSNFANNILYDFWPLIGGVVFIWFAVAWFFHSSLIRSMAHSHAVSRIDEPELYNMLENLSITAGIMMPKLEIIETHARNAFASGINSRTYTVTVTRGLLNSLTKEEIEAVLAHELTHILNKDVRLLIVTIIFTGMVSFAAQLVWHNIRAGFLMRGRDKKGNGVFLMLALAGILWIGYIFTLVLRFAISRKREYMADAGAIELTKNPESMMTALMRIAGRDKIPAAGDDIAMMCIENSKGFMGLFTTHPPISKRIEAISLTNNIKIPDSNSLPPAKGQERFSEGADKGVNNKNPWLNRRRSK